MLFNLFIIAFLLFLNGFFVAAEFAFVGVRKTRIQQLANEGNLSAKLALDGVNNIDKYIAAVQLGITIASLGIGWVGESTLATLIRPLFDFLPTKGAVVATHTVSVTIAFTIITVLHVVVGELMPKSIALQYPEKTTLWVAKSMFIVTKIFSPFIFLLNGLGNLLLKICNIQPNNGHGNEHTTEELNMLIDASYKGGILNEKEAEMLQNVFKFADLVAKDVMVPRLNIVAMPIEANQEEVNNIIIENQYTRYPVYEKDVDNIVGFVHLKDIYPILAKGGKVNLSSILRDAFRIPETMQIDKLASEFQKNHFQMAIVIDEFGGTSGLVTYEDVMEEVFGEVQDEFDDEESLDVKKLPNGKYEVCGMMRIDEFCEFFDVSIEDEDIQTIGGYVVKMLGKIAEEQDMVQDKSFKFCVVKTVSTRIDKLHVERVFTIDENTKE